ncbi:hypothetical protein [Duganella callida]|nr:hypothetical protein [Duganella callida]
MTPLEIFAHLITSIGVIVGVGASVWLYRDAKKKYPHKKTAGSNRPVP